MRIAHMLTPLALGAWIAHPIMTAPASATNITFEPPVHYPHNGGQFTRAVLGDVDGDGMLDVASGAGHAALGKVWLGAGDGTLVKLTEFPTPFDVTSMDMADLNEDGFDDLVQTTFSGPVVVWLSQGDGTFERPALYAPGTGFADMRIADLDGDGHLDVAAASPGKREIAVLLGRGDGTLNPLAPISLGFFGASGLVVADFSTDGVPDIVITLASSTTYALLEGNGDGTFLSYVLIPGHRDAPLDPIHPISGDFNEDGFQDFAVGSIGALTNSLAVVLGGAGGSFRPQKPAPLRLPVLRLLAADIDQDGHLDLVYTSAEGPPISNVKVARGRGDGSFDWSHADVYNNRQQRADWFDIGDLNGDGRPDLVTEDAPGIFDPFATVVLLNNSNRPPIARAGGAVPVECASLTGADLALDGSASLDPDGDLLDYEWSTDCPSPRFDDPIAPTTAMTLSGPPPCPLACSVTLTVTDPLGESASGTLGVTVADTTSPDVVAVLKPLDPLPPRRPTSAASLCSPPSSRRFRIVCGATDRCDPAPSLDARLIVTLHEVTDSAACVERIEEQPVACGQLLSVHLVPPPCPLRPPRPPRTAFSVRSDGELVVAGEAVTLEVRSSDRCGNESVVLHDPAVAPSPLCDEVLADGTCCPAMAAPAPPGCKSDLCGSTTAPLGGRWSPRGSPRPGPTQEGR